MKSFQFFIKLTQNILYIKLEWIYNKIKERKERFAPALASIYLKLIQSTVRTLLILANEIQSNTLLVITDGAVL